eukprot:6178590-Pleurochrysis_carterae.AAC.1
MTRTKPVAQPIFLMLRMMQQGVVQRRRCLRELRSMSSLSERLRARTRNPTPLPPRQGHRITPSCHISARSSRTLRLGTCRRYVIGGYVSEEEAGDRLAQVHTPRASRRPSFAPSAKRSVSHMQNAHLRGPRSHEHPNSRIASLLLCSKKRARVSV